MRVRVRLYMYYCHIIVSVRSLVSPSQARRQRSVNVYKYSCKLSSAHLASLSRLTSMYVLSSPSHNPSTASTCPPPLSATARSPHRSMWEINALELPEPTRSCLIRLLGIPQYTWGEGKADEPERRKEEVD